MTSGRATAASSGIGGEVVVLLRETKTAMLNPGLTDWRWGQAATTPETRRLRALHLDDPVRLEGVYRRVDFFHEHTEQIERVVYFGSPTCSTSTST